MPSTERMRKWMWRSAPLCSSKPHDSSLLANGDCSGGASPGGKARTMSKPRSSKSGIFASRTFFMVDQPIRLELTRMRRGGAMSGRDGSASSMALGEASSMRLNQGEEQSCRPSVDSYSPNSSDRCKTCRWNLLCAPSSSVQFLHLLTPIDCPTARACAACAFAIFSGSTPFRGSSNLDHHHMDQQLR